MLPDTQHARKYVKWVHSQDHRSVVFDNLARLPQHVLVVEGRKLLRSVINSSMTCRKDKRKAEEQIMSLLLELKLEQHTPFNVIRITLWTVNAWWEEHAHTVFPLLLTRSKMHLQKRNL